MSKELLNIRPMIEEDFNDASLIVTHAFKGKMVMLKSWSEEKIRDLLLYLHIFDKNNLEGHYVITQEKLVVGVLCLK